MNNLCMGQVFALRFDVRSNRVNFSIPMGPFKYYVIKEVDGWGQKMAIFDDLQYCKLSKRRLGGP